MQLTVDFENGQDDDFEYDPETNEICRSGIRSTMLCVLSDELGPADRWSVYSCDWEEKRWCKGEHSTWNGEPEIVMRTCAVTQLTQLTEVIKLPIANFYISGHENVVGTQCRYTNRNGDIRFTGNGFSPNGKDWAKPPGIAYSWKARRERDIGLVFDAADIDMASLGGKKGEEAQEQEMKKMLKLYDEANKELGESEDEDVEETGVAEL